MEYRVDISPSALQDAEDAYLWIKKSSPSRAAVWYEGLLEAFYGLEQMPARCSIAPESKDLAITIRQLVYGKKGKMYRILFMIEARIPIANAVASRDGRLHAWRDAAAIQLGY